MGDVPAGEGHIVIFHGKFQAFPFFILFFFFFSLDCDRFVKVKWYFVIKPSTPVISAHFPLMPYLLSDLGVTLTQRDSSPERLIE